MTYLIAYDISEDHIRNKVAKLLNREGYERIQYSLFAGPDDPKKNVGLWSKLTQLNEQEEKNQQAKAYKVFVIPVPTKHLMSMEIIGDVGIDLDYITGTKSTMFV